ncbi:MAG: aspartate--tRNA ligase [Patescibacteria group bacterium]|nr:aspartate--tRNA ligase [Patescibacteria group bacterium]
MEKTFVKDTPEGVGKKITVAGWVHARRDMGKIIFIDLRDSTGLLQVVFPPKDAGLLEQANALRPEFCIAITGTVNERPEKMRNPNMKTGGVELSAETLEVLNESKTPPFEVDKDTMPINEELRMKHRYLDLRSDRMHRNIMIRDKVVGYCRSWLRDKGFLEIETPILTKGTPEGAREYIVPSRMHPGQFFVLPQSPQQFKQLLMVSGFERYFQFARCFRDEDPRGDRQFEFTQLDLEMSFVDKEEEVMGLMEELMIAMVEQEFPEKRIQKKPFPRITYAESMEKYGNDKPDLRENKDDANELAFAWVTDFPLFEHSDTEGRLVSSHHPFTAPKDEDVELLDSEPGKARAKAYDLVLNGYEVGGGSIRIHKRDLQNKIFELLGLEKEEIQKRFGHILEAFEYGAPPHGGIAPGIARLVMILAGEPNIREVIPFPKTGDARCPLMGAPSDLPPSRLKEANITTDI